MSRRRPGWLIATFAVVGVSVVPAACGADPALQHREATVLATTCASILERDGHDPAPAPPVAFMLDFLRKPPHHDAGPNTKVAFAKRCADHGTAHAGAKPTP